MDERAVGKVGVKAPRGVSADVGGSSTNRRAVKSMEIVKSAFVAVTDGVAVLHEATREVVVRYCVVRSTKLRYALTWMSSGFGGGSG